jgi:uncharacterized membrane protein YphA (DoxX/SURF4 family)
MNFKWDYKNHITNLLVLMSLSILVEIAVAYVTWIVFQSYIDYYDYLYHYTHVVIPLFQQGLLPYLNYDWEYPILSLIPDTLAGVLAYLTNNFYVLLVFTIWFMVVCTSITILCIYFIALKIYNDNKKAFFAGVLYATAISVAYFTVCRFDPFPVMLVMLALLFTIRGDELKGYLSTILGFFTKIFPIVLLPFLVVYNIKNKNNPEKLISVLSAVGMFILLFAILALPIILMNPDALSVYFLRTEMVKGVFVSTLAYTISAWSGFPVTYLSKLMYVIGGLLLAFLLLILHAYRKDPVILLKCVMVALVAIVVCSQYHSPQYFMWFIPIAAILCVGDWVKIGLFYLFQVVEYIKFPLMYDNLFNNDHYLTAFHSQDWWTTLLFFTVEFVALILLVCVIVKPGRISWKSE